MPPGADSGRAIAPTLREVCGLTTEEIATRSSPLRRPWRSIVAPGEFATRRFRIRCRRWPASPIVSTASCVVYLVFNEGYFASSKSLTRHDLSGEAIQLGRLLTGCCGPEAIGLLGRCCCTVSTRRASVDGD
jgi:RNA polymerase sigma-70 factor (ECF subfamily)